MGNTQQQTNQPKFLQTGSDKLVVQLRSRSIIIHYGYKFSLNIGDVAMFPHGLSGLKLWQSNIVLARFVVMNNSLFKNKKILELGAGTGIGGITVSKWTKCQSIAMSDSRQQVIKNMTKNCERNSVKDIIIFRLNLGEFHHFTNKYDIILCSQILRPSPISLQQIYSLFKHFLNPDGCAYIVMSDNVEKIQQFSDLVDSSQFQFKYQKLVEQEYYASPLLNKVEGYKEFEMLQQEDYYVVKMKRKESQKEEDKPHIMKKLPELPKNTVKNEQKIIKNEEQSNNISPIKTFNEDDIEKQNQSDLKQDKKYEQKIQPATVKNINQSEGLQEPLKVERQDQKLITVQPNDEIALSQQQDIRKSPSQQLSGLKSQQSQVRQEKQSEQTKVETNIEQQAPVAQTPVIQSQQIQSIDNQQEASVENKKQEENGQNLNNQIHSEQKEQTQIEQTEPQHEKGNNQLPIDNIHSVDQSNNNQSLQHVDNTPINVIPAQNQNEQLQIVQQTKDVDVSDSHQQTQQVQQNKIDKQPQQYSQDPINEQTSALSKPSNLQLITHVETLQSKTNSDQVIQVNQQQINQQTEFVKSNELQEQAILKQVPQTIQQSIQSSHQNINSSQAQSQIPQITVNSQKLGQQVSIQHENAQNIENHQFQSKPQQSKHQESTQPNNESNLHSENNEEKSQQNTHQAKNTQNKSRNKKNKRKR